MIRVFLLLVLSTATCFADSALTLRQLEFKAWFGQQRLGGSSTMYCLLGAGALFQTPATDDAEQIIASWIAAHPDAEVTIVDRELASTRDNFYSSYVWVQDGEDNLNLSLVRQGVVPAGVMADGIAYLSTLPDVDKTDKYFPKRLVSDVQYEIFFQRAVEAEALAIKERKGIWSDYYRERRRMWGIE